MAADEPELFIINDRSGDLLIAVQVVNAAPVFKQGIEDPPAAGQPVGHTLGGLVEHEQVELRSQLLVVALHGLLDQGLVGLEGLLVREGIGIDPLQGITVLIAAPVGARHAADLKGRSHELLGIGDMRAAAQIHEIISGIIDSDPLVRRQVLDQLGLELLSLEQSQRLIPGHLLLRPVLAPLEDLFHLILDQLEIILVHLSGQNEIIIETVRDLRSDRVLYVLFSKDLKHCLGQNVGQGMTIHFQILFSFHTLFPPLLKRPPRNVPHLPCTISCPQKMDCYCSQKCMMKTPPQSA